MERSSSETVRRLFKPRLTPPGNLACQRGVAKRERRRARICIRIRKRKKITNRFNALSLSEQAG
jgi:hypothetical protein